MRNARLIGLEWAPGRVIVSGGAGRAVKLAGAFPGVALDVFELSWSAVDFGRELVLESGLGARVHVWHIDAMPFVRRRVLMMARAA